VRTGGAGGLVIAALLAAAVVTPAQAGQAPPAALSDPAAVTLEGDEARRSAPALAAVRWLEQLHSGDDAALRATLRGDPNIAALSDEQLTFLLGFARALMPQPQAFASRIDRVVITGDDAEVSAPAEENARVSVSLRRSGGEWTVLPTRPGA
jgi:hypothetical protein